MKKIILVSGKATHGKDEVSKLLVNYLSKYKDKKKIRCIKMAYGDLLKYICKQYFGWNGEKNDQGRMLLQKVGTDICDKNNPYVWSKTLIEIIKAIWTEFDYIIISDARFKKEITDIKKAYKNKVITVRVNRIHYISPLTKEQQNHPTETDLDNYRFDKYIVKDTMKKLQKDCKKLAKEIYEQV